MTLEAELAPVDPGLQTTELVLSTGPDLAETIDRAIALHQGGRLAEAERIYLAILKKKPDHFDAMHLLGVIRHQQGRDHDALELLSSLLAKNSRSAPALSNLGAVLHKLERYQEALDAYDKALAIRPDDPQTLYNRGTALKELDRADEALNSYDQALALKPDFPDALFNRSALLVELRRFDAAIASYERALAIEPHHRLAFSGLLDAALHICDWRRAARFAEQLTAHIVERQSSIEPFALLGMSDDPALHLDCARNFIREKVKILAAVRWREMRPRRERIRIAYLSPDFRSHAVAFLAAALFELHDRSRFEVIGISFGPDDGSAMRARLVHAFDQFHDVRSISDLDAANLLKTLEIDILVDLAGYTRDCRPGILARRPAPIQVSYLGYPGTMGADFTDYVIADPIALPLDQQRFYIEKIVHLPDCYQVNDPQREISGRTPTKSEAGLPNEGFVFCCFNNSYKISAPVFDVWMRLLAAVEKSVCGSSAATTWAADNLRNAAGARGPAGAPEELLATQRQMLFDQTAEQRAKLAALDRQRAQKEAEKATYAATIAKLEAMIPILQERTDIRKYLADKQVGSKVIYLENLTELVQQQKELAVQQSHLHEAEAALAAVIETRAQAIAEYRRTRLGELATAEAKAAGLAQDVVKASERSRLQLLEAPVDGTVQQLAVQQSGASSLRRKHCSKSYRSTAISRSRRWSRTAMWALSAPDSRPRSR